MTNPSQFVDDGDMGDGSDMIVCGAESRNSGMPCSVLSVRRHKSLQNQSWKLSYKANLSWRVVMSLTYR